MSDDNGKSDKDNQWQSPRAPHQQKEEEDTKLWGILLFGLIGASATTLAVSSFSQSSLFSLATGDSILILFVLVMEF